MTPTEPIGRLTEHLQVLRESIRQQSLHSRAEVADDGLTSSEPTGLTAGGDDLET